MQHIASYPMTEQMLTPYIGRPVIGVTHHGDRFIGTIQSCTGGQLCLVPIQSGATTPAAVQSLQKQLSNHSKVKKLSSKNKHRSKISKHHLEKAKLSFWGPGYGYGLGRGFFGAGLGFGLGAGLGFTIPLLAIGALFATPFWI